MLPILLALVACGTDAKTGDTGASEDTADTAETSSGPEVLLAAGDLDAPTDATPSADASSIYFVTDGTAGSFLYEITDAGVTSLASFTHARGLVVGPEGDTVYVADPGADGLFSVSTAGGEASVIMNTQGFAPTAVEISNGELYFAGTDPMDGGAAVYRISLSGGMPALVATAPVELDGVVVGPDGVVYAAGGGTVFSIVDGMVSALAEDLTLGDPAGLALTPDDSTLMVSSLSAEGTSQVVLIDLATGAISTYDDVIGANVGSGGLHRAQGDASVYAWCGITSGGEGSVYRINF